MMFRVQVQTSGTPSMYITFLFVSWITLSALYYKCVNVIIIIPRPATDLDLFHCHVYRRLSNLFVWYKQQDYFNAAKPVYCEHRLVIILLPFGLLRWDIHFLKINTNVCREFWINELQIDNFEIILGEIHRSAVFTLILFVYKKAWNIINQYHITFGSFCSKSEVNF